ncbi:ATP-grasp domain-containing protein [Conservatibacter flavescens]|uniref:ATP-grasp domain-containing protein n=1 Tax=Conservatibacter flavescens TaxID=28161 RepID=A0A2M8S2S8_9PAST|nr:ATP-grasp domain-containing protein [Conservatibacter flavescens]PJG85460.1 hypothetical protein CVP05_06165 [Conservatibacter flavescens]
MKLFIILQDVVIFRSNWANLIDKENYFLLIRSNKLLHVKEQLNYFNKVITLTEYNLKNISNELDVILNSSDYKWSDVKVLCNDEYCLPLAAKLREKFNIVGDNSNIIAKFTNKLVMKNLLHNRVKKPKYIEYNKNDIAIDEIEKILNYPIIAKPTNLAACDGVVKIHCKNELESWLNNNKNTSDYELDEYIEGVLFHIDSVIFNNEILNVFVGEYSSPVAEFITGKAVGTRIVNEKDKNYIKLIEYNRNLLEIMQDLPNCVTHLEVFINKKEEIVFLEIAARAAGGMIPQMYQLAYGINIEEIHFQLQMGKKVNIPINLDRYVGWLWYPQIEGMYLDKNTDLKIKSQHILYWDIDERVKQKKAVSIRDRLGGIIIHNKNYEQLIDDYNWLCNHYFPYKKSL